jgi:hypothetical protein
MGRQPVIALLIIAAALAPFVFQEKPAPKPTVEVTYIRIRPVAIGGIVAEQRDTLIVNEPAEGAQ